MEALIEKTRALLAAPWLRRLWDSDLFWTTWILLAALALGVIAAYLWIRRREEPYLRDRTIEAIQGLVYKKAWSRAYELIRKEPFNPEYKRLTILYRLDELLAALRNIYQARGMPQRPVDEIARLADQMHAIEEEIAEVQAEADRKAAFLRKQLDQLRGGIRARWSALPPLAGEEPKPPAPDEPPFEAEDAKPPAPAAGPRPAVGDEGA